MPKISELPAASSLSDSDTVVVVQGGVTKKAAKSLLGGGAGTVPTGTGFRHVTAGVEDAAAVGESGTGDVCRVNTPTLVTPVLGAATGTSVVVSAQLAAGTFVSVGSTVASTGSVRLAHSAASAAGVYVRNAGNTADVPLIRKELGDGIEIGHGTDAPTVNVRASTSFGVIIGASQHIAVSATYTRLYRLALQDSDNTASYIFAPSNLAADRTVTLPLLTGNDTFVTEAHTQTLDAKTLTGVPYLAFAGTVPATGTIRLAVGNTIKSVVGGTDRQLFEYGAGAELIFGEWTNGGPIYLRANSAGEVRIQINSDNQLVATASLLQVAKPRVGFSVPYASEGEATESTDANTTLAASVYSRGIVRFNGAYSAVRTYTFPHPASADASYVKPIRHTGSTNNITISTGTGTTASIAPAATGIYAFTTGGVSLLAS